MSNGSLTTYYFIPSLRRGLAAGITGPVSEQDTQKHRSVLEVGMAVKVEQALTDEDPKFDKSIQLLGPGDVLGFDPRVVARTDPLNNVGDFEPNYFPAIEFSEPDFPWRFTANKAEQGTGQLLPWVSLIVLVAETTPDQSKQKEFEEGVSEITSVPLIEVETSNLPDLDHAWRWAHAQTTAQSDLGDQAIEEELKRIIRNEPERAVSRLVCPRRLRPGIKYHAYMVPTFKLGVDRALGKPLSDGDDALTLAWTAPASAAENTSIRLPYYYKWEFRTGLRGDFEHLIRQLEPRSLPDLGLREVDCGDPGFGLKGTIKRDDRNPDDEDYHVLGFESALKSTNTRITPWGKDSGQQASGDGFRSKLGEKLNQSVDLYTNLGGDETPLVVAPVYGRWHRGRTDPDSEDKPDRLRHDNGDWLDELNLDPRHRAAAGIGAELVKKQQEQLMASAWDQLGPIEEANEILKRAQFGREIGNKLDKRLQLLMPGNYLRTTSALHARLTMPGEAATVSKKIHASPIRKALLDPALRRVARKRGAFRKRQKPDLDKRNDMLLRLNSGEINITDAKIPARGLAGIEDITKSLAAAVSPGIVGELPVGEHEGEFLYTFRVSTAWPGVHTSIDVPNKPRWLSWTRNQDGTVTLRGTPPSQPIPGKRFVSVPKRYPITIRITQGGTPNRQFERRFTLVARTRLESVQRVGHLRAHSDRYLHAVHDITSKTVWQLVDIKKGQAKLRGADPEKWFYEKNVTADLARGSSAPGVESDAVAQTLDGWLQTDVTTPAAPTPINNVNALCDVIRGQLSPEKTIVQKTAKRLDLNFEKPRKPEQALDTIMVAPEFPQPLYEAVEEISQELILAGIDRVPQNTLTLLEMSRAIEGILCGANHEMARELLWRGYPTDQRGSYFRQFFSVTDYVPKEEDLPEYLRCYREQHGLREIDQWDRNDKLRYVRIYRQDQQDIAALPDDELNAIVGEILEEKGLDEALKDVPPLHQWRAARLGCNVNNFCSENSAAEKLVLLIRGDVLKKYPNTVIYAVKQADDDFEPDLPEFTGNEEPGDIRYPIFGAKVKPDITFVGFDLTEENARDENWYFVLQERVSEARFGMDVPSDKVLEIWDDLAWHHFDISSDQYLNSMSPTEYLNGVDPSEWGVDSAWLGSTTLQKPVRIIVSAKQMLPAEDEEAYFEFKQNGSEDTFVIKLVDPEKIRQGRNILKGCEAGKKGVTGIIVKEKADYNPDWSYHLDPDSIDFFDAAMEVCDATMRSVEEHLDEVGGALLPGNRWCPWGSYLTAEKGL